MNKKVKTIFLIAISNKIENQKSRVINVAKLCWYVRNDCSYNVLSGF